MSSWNNRLVRTKHITKLGNENRIFFTYGIHEAFYDKLGKVVAITKKSVEPFGDNVKDCRHSWIMMAEAFGKPILDADKIPEEGHDTNNNLVNTNILQKEIEEAREDTEENRELTKVLNDSLIKFDMVAFQKEEEKNRLSSEIDHQTNFCNFKKLKDIVDAIFSEYDTYRKEQRDNGEVDIITTQDLEGDKY